MQRRRTRWLFIAVTAFVLVGVGSTAYWRLFAMNYEQTDDAYVAGDLVNVSSQISGTVVSIDADETDFVQKGQ
jgi:membrane fusion protein (multidrug efflux system)